MKCLITGGAGFIGSNLARYLLQREHEVVILDNFATGFRHNLADIEDQITLIEGDLRNIEDIQRALVGVEAVSHQGALGSVPRSIEDPVTTHEVNVNGTINVLEAMREAGIKRIVFAASSSAYGERKESPKIETMTPMPISPYAASKACCESYVYAYSAAYGFESVGLRYFNVFGPRQDPNGAYAAVIPRFVAALLAGEQPVIYGDGEQSRDFCYIDNVCRANELALTNPADRCDGSVVNIACGERVSLNEILAILGDLLSVEIDARYEQERPGDVKHSLADISRAKKVLGYEPKVYFRKGLEMAIDWYRSNQNSLRKK
jgi:nucleoside-diphosphate-sugar epimerase